MKKKRSTRPSKKKEMEKIIKGEVKSGRKRLKRLKKIRSEGNKKIFK